MSVPESSIWRQITWNLDSRWLVALAIWLAIAAGIATLARLSRRSPAATAGARAVAIAGVLGLAVNLRRPEVMYAVWLIVPAAIGLAVAAAHPPARLARAAAAFVVLLVAGNAAYMTMRIVTTRALSYREFARSIRQCVVEPAPDGTLLLVDSLPEVYLSFIDARERLRIRLPSPTSGDRERRPLLEQLDAIFLGPLAHDPSWAFAIEAAREEWTVVPLREAGGYGGRLAMRRGREYAIPSSCTQHFYSAFRH